MKNSIKKLFGFLLAFAIILTGIPVTVTQAATVKPVISSSQATIKKNSCTITKGKKVKLTAKSGKINITKKGTWKSSQKTVATVNKKGVLTAKKAGTTYITITYKKKTSKKLKVVVKKKSTATPGSENTAGAYTITYKKNDSNAKLSGSATQSVSGEILKFGATVTPASGKKFLGWYTAKTGGKQVYETYVPTKNITLYAHYTTENVQTIKFSLGCSYDQDVVTFMGSGTGYDFINKKDWKGPMTLNDSANCVWSHNYVIKNKKSITVDELPQPSISGYTFVGWYTVEQGYDPNSSGSVNFDGGHWVNFDSGVQIKNGDVIDTSITTLYARFSKKLTISFDDLHGGKYDDIVIDTYTSIADAGYSLPVVNIPGATFTGWSLTNDSQPTLYLDGTILGGSSYQANITENKKFSNLIFILGYMCTAEHSIGYSPYFLSSNDWAAHRSTSDCYHAESGGGYSDYTLYLETDHVTLYPTYIIHEISVPFDPKGGTFYNSYEQDCNIKVFTEDLDNFKAGFGYMTLSGSFSYDAQQSALPKVRRINYLFDKWCYLDSDGNEQEFTYDTVIVDDMQVYATWKLGVCSVKFNPGDGTFTQQELTDSGIGGSWSYSVTTESTVAKDGKRLPVPYSLEGREFLGWFTKDGEPFTENTQVLENTSVYAEWGTLPKDLPVVLKFDADGGTFKADTPNLSETGVVTKEVTKAAKIGQLPELEDHPDYVFVGWYVMKPDAMAPYEDSDYLSSVTANTSVNTNWINDQDEILIMAKWRPLQHIEEIYMTDVTDFRNTFGVDKDNNHYTIEYNGKDREVGFAFMATLLPATADDSLKNVRWTSSNSTIIYVGDDNVIYSGNDFYQFYFGDNVGDVVLTATSVDNPNVKFDIYVTVTKQEQQ